MKAPILVAFIATSLLVCFSLLFHALNTSNSIIAANTQQFQAVRELLERGPAGLVASGAGAPLPALQSTTEPSQSTQSRPFIISEFIRAIGYRPPGEIDPSPFFKLKKHPSFDVVIDVGGYNCKDYTMTAFRAGYTVYTFELNPNNVAMCLRTFAEAKLEEGRDYTVIPVTPGQVPTVPAVRKLAHIYFFKAGVSNRVGGTVVHQGDVMSQINVNKTTGDIPLVRIDDVVDANSKVYVFKSDTQGHEYGVLTGAANLIRTGKIFLMALEFWPQGSRENGFNAKKTLDFVYQNNFMCFDTAYNSYNYWGRPAGAYEFVDFFDSLKTPIGAWDDLVCTRFDS